MNSSLRNEKTTTATTIVVVVDALFILTMYNMLHHVDKKRAH